MSHVSYWLEFHWIAPWEALIFLILKLNPIFIIFERLGVRFCPVLLGFDRIETHI